MNQKQIEQTRVIAEKDGWTFRNNGDTAELFTNGEFVMGCHGWKETPDFPIHKYLTDLNALHKVAMDVMDELPLLSSNQHLIWCCMAKRPINGQYIALFNAVYDGVVFLNRQKSKP